MAKEHEPPVGPELKVAQQVNREVHKLNEDMANGLTIFTDHTLKGVRCNGNEQLHNVTHDIAALVEYHEDCLVQYGELATHIDKVERSLKFINDSFKKVLLLCNTCNGRGGTGNNGSYKNPWEDCSDCDGRGLHVKV